MHIWFLGRHGPSWALAGRSSWPPGSCAIIVQRFQISGCLNAPFCSPSETRCRKTPAAARLAAESERIGLLDYISVFIQQQREKEREKKFCLVQYPALALTKVWKFRAARTHTGVNLSPPSPPPSTPPPALSFAKTNSNYSSLRQPLKNAGLCLLVGGGGSEKKNNNNTQPISSTVKRRSQRFFWFSSPDLLTREKSSVTQCHREDQCVNFVSLWDPLLWHLAQLWRLEKVFNIPSMFPGTYGKHPQTFVHDNPWY